MVHFRDAMHEIHVVQNQLEVLNLTFEDDSIHSLAVRAIFLPGMLQNRCRSTQLCIDPIFFLMWDILIIWVFLHYLENPYGLGTLFSCLFQVTILRGFLQG